MSGADPTARDKSHYSYAHYANADVAAGFDALRFGGPIGELLAETQEHVLVDFLMPLDRTHDVKLYGTYAFGALNVSGGVELESGAPLTALASHPVYGAGGEIPLTPRGAGFQTSSGFETRTPWTKPVNLGASYKLKTGGSSLLLIADVFNVFNTQTILDYDAYSELTFGVPNPDFGTAGVSGVVAGQQLTAPRQLRIGVRYEF